MKAKTKTNTSSIDAELFKTFRDVYPNKDDCDKAVNEAKKAYLFLHKNEHFGNINLFKKS